MKLFHSDSVTCGETQGRKDDEGKGHRSHPSRLAEEAGREGRPVW